MSMLDRWTDNEIPILMDEVECASSSTNFLSCTTRGWGVEDCDYGGYDGNVLLTCTDSGYIEIYVLIPE